MKLLTQTAIVAAVLTSGCASPDLDYGFAQGWRRVQVLDILDQGKQTDPVAVDCRQKLRGEGNTAQRYALVTEVPTGTIRVRDRRIVVIPPALELHVGNLAYANVNDCRLPLKRLSDGGG